MSDVVDIKPVPTNDFEFVADLARYRENLLDEKAIRKKYRLADDVWEKLGDDDELIRKVEETSVRRIRDGSSKRERAQQLIVKGPDILSGIMNDVTANARHRINSVKVLDDLAANGPAAAAAGTYFEIFINLGADQDGKPVIEHYRKPVAIDVNRSSTDDIDPNVADTGVIAAIEMTKAKSGGDNGGHI